MRALTGFASLLLTFSVGCGDDGGGVGTMADRYGVGAECGSDEDCEQTALGVAESCLTQFKGGYCGIADCSGDSDCPGGSKCVAHDDGVNYCFRTCQEKPECNLHRDADREANCSSSITYVEPADGGVDDKACVPPNA